MQTDSRTAARLFLAWVVALMAGLVVPAGASADTVDLHVQAFGPTSIVSHTNVTIPTSPVTPLFAADPTQSCAGNSIVGIINAATGGSWGGTWTDGQGWSIDSIQGSNALVAQGRKWLVMVDWTLKNGPPCTTLVTNNDLVTLYPACLPGTTSGCYTQGMLDMRAPISGGPGAPIHVVIHETKVTGLNVDGSGGSSTRSPSSGASVQGPENSALTDTKYGTGEAILTIDAKGPASIISAKNGFAPDQGGTCITDGNDGYCGTQAPSQVPFDPYAFCQTTGNDGYCNSPDQVAPVGHITAPAQATAFGKNGGPTDLKGTVDFDPSLTDHVNLRLMKQNVVTVTKYKKKKVWVKKKVRGKKKPVRKRVTKRVKYKVKQTRCYGWNETDTEFKQLKKCDPSLATQWKAEGAEVWHFEFLSKLPTGSYTLDALATDGANNTDATPEIGRNRVTFKVS